jgi:hypothetical protein
MKLIAVMALIVIGAMPGPYAGAQLNPKCDRL